MGSAAAVCRAACGVVGPCWDPAGTLVGLSVGGGAAGWGAREAVGCHQEEMSPMRLLSAALGAGWAHRRGSRASERSAPRSLGRESSGALGTGSTSASPSPGPKPSDSRPRELRGSGGFGSAGAPLGTGRACCRGSSCRTRGLLGSAPPGSSSASPGNLHANAPRKVFYCIYRTASKKFSRRSCQGLFSSRLLRSRFFIKGGENQTLKVAAVAHPVPDAGDGSGTSARRRGASPSAPCAFC